MNKQMLLLVVLFSLSTYSCEKDEVKESTNTDLENLYESNKEKITILQGISGTLIMKEGNCMPMIGTNSGTCRAFPIKRIIQIYEYTLLSDIEGYGPDYDTVHTNLIGETESDEDGFFQFQLDAGKYSIFILENGKYYANGIDGDGVINPVQIIKDGITIQNQAIDYAVY